MKKLILLSIIALVPLFSKGQTFKPDNEMKSSFTDVPAYLLDTVSVSKLKKEQLYSNALNYVTKSFADSRAVLEMKDLSLGEVAFKGTISTSFTDTVKTKKKTEVLKEVINLHFKCKIYVKDEKFKIVLSSLEIPMTSLLPNSLWTLRKEDYQPYNKAGKQAALLLIKSIADFMNRTPENEF